MAILRIELLEDCDLNSGRVLNTYFAEDVFYDSFGFPYIPAWIIRNSLAAGIKKSRIRLSDNQMANLLAGKESLIMTDAVIADRESMKQAILQNRFDSILMQNPQIVLEVGGFTKVKEISGNKGESFIRVLSKGSIFEAYFELPDQYMDIFRTIISQAGELYVGHLVRTRFSLDENWERPHYIAKTPYIKSSGAICRMDYDLHLLSRTVAIDHLSNRADTPSFVKGSQIRDALSLRDELSEIFEEENRVRCSFAYIEISGKRGLPIPAGFYTKKQDKNDLRDFCSEGKRKDDCDQIEMTGNLYIDDPDGQDIYAVSVRTEQGTFQIDEEGRLSYKSFNAIAGEQTFKGFIEGRFEDLERIAKSLEKNGYIPIGDMCGFGFGNSFLSVRSVRPVEAPKTVLADEITLLLLSPARLYTDGYYEASAARVMAEIQSRLGETEELEIVKSSQKTIKVANFNKYWGEMEPLEYAVDAGSVYRIRSRNGSKFDISPILGGIFIGRHNDMGYGEALVFPAKDIYYRSIRYGEFTEKNFNLTFKVGPNPGRRLMLKLYQSNADAMASYAGASKAKEFVKEMFKEEPLKSICTALNEDFDKEEAFEAYIDALKMAGLNAIRRKHRD